MHINLNIAIVLQISAILVANLRGCITKDIVQNFMNQCTDVKY